MHLLQSTTTKRNNMNKKATTWFAEELGKIIATAQAMQQELDSVTPKSKKEKSVKEVIVTPPPHPLGDVLDQKYLSVKIVQKETRKNTALIWVEFPNNLKPEAYYYTPEKIEYDDGFAWNVEEGKCYIIQNVKYSITGRWVWERYWEITNEEWIKSPFKISQKLDIIQTKRLENLEDKQVLAGFSNPIQKQMCVRADKRSGK